MEYEAILGSKGNNISISFTIILFYHGLVVLLILAIFFPENVSVFRVILVLIFPHSD